MPNSANPGFITFEYHSAYGAHEQQVPTLTINPDFDVPADTTIDTWNSGTINWVTMANDLAEQMATRFPATVNYDRATLWLQLLPTDLPTFIASTLLDIPGAATTPGYTKSVQETVTVRDTGGYLAKLVFLDMASGNNFDKQLDADVAGLNNLLEVWFNPDNGWNSRAGYRPATFIKATRTLNEKLRKQYGDT